MYRKSRYLSPLKGRHIDLFEWLGVASFNRVFEGDCHDSITQSRSRPTYDRINYQCEIPIRQLVGRDDMTFIYA